MKREIAVTLIDTPSMRPFAPGAGTLQGHVLPVCLSKAVDRLALGLAVMAPPNSAGLDLEYAEAMVEAFDEWFALKGLRARKGGL